MSKIYVGENAYLEVSTSYQEEFIGEFTGRWRIDTTIYGGRQKVQTLYLEVKTHNLIFGRRRWIRESKIYPAIVYDDVKIKGDIQEC